jgi:hypothetical protein
VGGGGGGKEGGSGRLGGEKEKEGEKEKKRGALDNYFAVKKKKA